MKITLFILLQANNLLRIIFQLDILQICIESLFSNQLTNNENKLQQMQDQNNKVERIALQLNKTGLTYLSNQQGSSNAFEYFKKAQKMLLGEVQIDSTKKNIQSLLAVTYNNLAIYYKRTNKPKAALSYLKNALQIQTFILEDWLATATTHLNICAIYSFMSKHEQAVDHANLSIENAKKAKTQINSNQKDANAEKSCVNVQLASMYNLAVEFEHLKKFQQAIETYKKSRDSAKQLGRKNIETNSQESIDRLTNQMMKNKRKLIELLQKKKENEEKGNYESMRRNKKNFKSSIEENPLQEKTHKYRLYDDYKKRTQSVSKIVSLRPIHSHSTEGIKKKHIGSGIEKREQLRQSNKDLPLPNQH